MFRTGFLRKGNGKIFNSAQTRFKNPSNNGQNGYYSVFFLRHGYIDLVILHKQ